MSLRTMWRQHSLMFGKYVVVGLAGTVIDVGLFAVLIARTFLGTDIVGRVVAASVSFVAAVINNYYWNRRWTFRNANNAVGRQFILFLLVSLGGWLLNTILFIAFSWLIIELSDLAQPLTWMSITAKVAASGLVLLYNYILNRSVTFRS